MPDLSNPLGQPYIIKPDDWINLAKASGYVAGTTSILPSITAITNTATSLVDNAYNQNLEWQKAKANLGEIMARTREIGTVSDLNEQRRDQDAQLFPLQLEGEKLGLQGRQQQIKENQFRLNEAQRNADETEKAHNEYQAWHDEIAGLDPTDPDYDNKVAEINAKYPEASTNPSTQRLISPLLQQQNIKRGQSFQVKQRNDQLNQLQTYQDSGLLPPDTDTRTEVNAGRGQSLINQAKRQSVINRLQTIIAYGDPQERLWAQNQLDSISGKYMGPGDQPDPTIFGPNGDLNPGTEALLSTIERRRGISPAAPGAKKETKVETDRTGTKTTTTITGQPVTQADISSGPNIQPTTPDMPTKPEDMQKDPVFQSVFSDLAAGKLVLPGDPKPGTPEYTAALFAEYAKRKGAAAGQVPVPKNTIQAMPPPRPSPVPAPTPKRARKGLSYEGPTQEDTDLAIQEATGRARFASAEAGIPSWYRSPRETSEPAFPGSLRAMAYGPSEGEYTRATLYGPLGHLQEGDIAVSPNLLDRFPLGSYVNVVDEKGDVLRANRRVADTSWISGSQPTTNSFELWNDKDLGHARLEPVSQTERRE